MSADEILRASEREILDGGFTPPPGLLVGDIVAAVLRISGGDAARAGRLLAITGRPDGPLSRLDLKAPAGDDAP